MGTDIGTDIGTVRKSGSVADTAFEKGGGALTQKIQINGFRPEFEKS